MANPIKLSELFNFSDDKDLREAIDLIKKMNSTYNEFIGNAKKMSGEYSTALSKVITDTNKLNDSLKGLNPTVEKDQIAIAGAAKQMDIYASTAKTLKTNIDTLKVSTEQLQKEQTDFNAKAKETVKVQTELERLEMKLAKLHTDDAAAIAKVKEQIIQKNAALKQSAKESLNAVSLYQKQSQALIDLRNKYKDLAVQHGVNSRQAKAAQVEMLKLDRAIKQIDAGAGQFQRNVGNYSSALSGLAGTARSFFAAFGIVGGVTMFAYLLRDTFQLIKQSETLNKALKQVTETTSEYANQVSYLQDLSNRYGINLNLLTESYIKFFVATKGTKLEGKATQEIFTSVTKSLAVMGATTADTERALKALSQMISKGKIQAEELRSQLGDVLPGALSIMAKAVGVTVGELDKMMKEGKLFSDEVLPKFAKELEKTFGVENLNNVNTLQAAQTRLTNSWILFVKSVEDGDGVISKAIKGTVNALSQGVALIAAYNNGTISLSELVGAMTNPLVTAQVQMKILTEQAIKASEEEKRQKSILTQAQYLYNEAVQSGAKTWEDYEAKFAKAIDSNINKTDILKLIQKQFNDDAEKGTEKQIENLSTLNAKLKEQQELRMTATRSELPKIDAEIKAIETKIAAFQDLTDGSDEYYTKYISGTIKAKKATGDLATEIEVKLPESLEKAETSTESTMTKLQALFRRLGDWWDKWSEQVSAAIQGVSNVVNQFAENQNIKRENNFARFEETQNAEIEKLEERRDRELSAERLTAEQKEAINQRYESAIGKIEDNIEKKRRDLQRKQAQSAKRQAVFAATINTAEAVTKALASAPPPANFILAGIVGGLGAVQIGAIAAQPLPAFAKGTDNAPAGPKIVGEKGREMWIEPSGKIGMTGNRAEVRTDIPEGSRILTNAITERLMRQKPIDDELAGNLNSQSKLSKIASENRLSANNLRQAMQMTLEKENDFLAQSILAGMSKLPLNNWSFDDKGHVTRSVQKGATLLEKVRLRNQY